MSRRDRGHLGEGANPGKEAELPSVSLRSSREYHPPRKAGGGDNNWERLKRSQT